MPPRSSLTVPTTAPLPSSLRLPPKHALVSKPLSRLSRPSLLILVTEWLRTRNQSMCGPYLSEEDNDDESMYPPAQTLEELREVYKELVGRRGGKREVLDRVLEGDWRHGLSLKQLAMVDVQYLLDHPAAVRWTALKLVKVLGNSEDSGYDPAPPDVKDELPRFHGPSFLTNLQKEIGTLMKTHYHLAHMDSIGVTLLRIYVLESPYNNQASLSLPRAEQSARSLLVAFPDRSPFVYVSTAAQSGALATDSRNLRKLVIDALPKALSRPKERWAFKTTSLNAKSLEALTSARGGGNTNAAGGGWSMFAQGSVEESPLKPSTGTEEETSKSQDTFAESTTETAELSGKRMNDGMQDLNFDNAPAVKRRKLLAERRFGSSAVVGNGKGIERLEIRMEDLYPELSTGQHEWEAGEGINNSSQGGKTRGQMSADKGANEDEDQDFRDDDWKPTIQITFHGSHIFAGIRQLVECGAVDGKEMPGWMTGEENVSVGVVRNGRIKGRKGAGV